MNSIEYNTLMDWKKKEVEPEERKNFLKNIIKREGISQRELARRLDLPQGTLNDWLTLRPCREKRIQVQVNKFNNHNTIFSLTNRLIFLLSKFDVYDEKTKKELLTLKEKIDLIK